MRQKIVKRVVLVTSALSLLALITTSGHTGAVNKPEETHSVAAAAAAAPGKTDQRLEFEVITITPEGFEPQEIVRSAGPFILSVTNQSGVDSLNVQIETEQRGKLREKSLPLETPYWREVINPPPGRYVITEPNHPEWTFSLIIQ